jgi:hypothetical protein
LIFLGAGASKAFAEIPTMKEMITDFEKQLPSQDPAFYKLYRDILDSLKGIYPEGLDLEAILSVLNGISKGRAAKELSFYSSYWAKKAGLDPLKGPAADLQGVASGNSHDQPPLAHVGRDKTLPKPRTTSSDAYDTVGQRGDRR